jgi:hypothetical protein
VGSLRVTGQRLGVEEITTFRDEVRVRPLELPEHLALELSERAPEASYHRTTKTLNLASSAHFSGRQLPGWVEDLLLEATGATSASAGPSLPIPDR